MSSPLLRVPHSLGLKIQCVSSRVSVTFLLPMTSHTGSIVRWVYFKQRTGSLRSQAQWNYKEGWLLVRITFLWSKVDLAHTGPFLHSGLLNNSAPKRTLTGETLWLSASSTCYMKETTTKGQIKQEAQEPRGHILPTAASVKAGPRAAPLYFWRMGKQRKGKNLLIPFRICQYARPKVLSSSKHLPLLMPARKGILLSCFSPLTSFSDSM